MSNDGMFAKLLDTDKPKPKSLPPKETGPVQMASPTIEKLSTPGKELVKNLRKKQISAYLSIPQHTIFKQLYHKLNSTEANIDKSEIIGLSLEILSDVIGDDNSNFPTLPKLKEYLEQKVSKYK